jgi:hypothetical protein
MTGQLPRSGQKTIPLADWKRFVRVADWWDRTYGHKPPAAMSPEYGDDLIVETPRDGIPAATATIIYSALCYVCVPVQGTAADRRTVTRTNNTIRVFNVFCETVPGELKMPTGLLTTGERYVLDWLDCGSDSSPSDSSPSESSESSSDSLPSESSPSDSVSGSESAPSSASESSQSIGSVESSGGPILYCHEKVKTCLLVWQFVPEYQGTPAYYYWRVLSPPNGDGSTCGYPEYGDCHCDDPPRDGLYEGELYTVYCIGP